MCLATIANRIPVALRRDSDAPLDRLHSIGKSYLILKIPFSCTVVKTTHKIKTQSQSQMDLGNKANSEFRPHFLSPTGVLNWEVSLQLI